LAVVGVEVGVIVHFHAVVLPRAQCHFEAVVEAVVPAGMSIGGGGGRTVEEIRDFCFFRGVFVVGGGWLVGVEWSGGFVRGRRGVG
jgi:hypothetical protein